MSLLKSVINLLGLLGLTAASSAIDAAVQKKLYGSGTTTLVISNEEMNDIMKIVQTLEDSNTLLKGVTKQLKMKQKNKKEDFLGTLGASLLDHLLAKNYQEKEL